MSLKLLTYRPENHHVELSKSIEELVTLVDAERTALASTRDW
jgi:hypothetical protein